MRWNNWKYLQKIVYQSHGHIEKTTKTRVDSACSNVFENSVFIDKFIVIVEVISLLSDLHNLTFALPTRFLFWIQTFYGDVKFIPLTIFECTFRGLNDKTFCYSLISIRVLLMDRKWCSHADSVLVHVAVTVHVINQQFVFESYSPIAGSLFGVQSGSLGSGGFSLCCTLWGLFGNSHTSLQFHFPSDFSFFVVV